MGFHHNFASEMLPRQARGLLMRAQCDKPAARRLYRNITTSELTTGTLTHGAWPETVAPTSVVLHRVKTCEQRRRAWGLAASWSARLRDTPGALDLLDPAELGTQRPSHPKRRPERGEREGCFRRGGGPRVVRLIELPHA